MQSQPPGPYGPPGPDRPGGSYHGTPPGPPGQPGGGRRRRGLVALLCVVALAGVAAFIALVVHLAQRYLPDEGAGPTQPAAGAPGPPLVTVGDQRTADPCSLLSELSVRKFGSPKTFDGTGSPASCAIGLRSDGPGGIVLTAVLTLNDPQDPPRGTPTPAGPLTVYRAAPSDGPCTRSIVTPDGNGVFLGAYSFDGGRGDLCTIAEAGVETAVAALSAGPIPRKPTTDPPNALTRINVCAIVDAEAARRMPGIDTSNRYGGFGDWSCSWGAANAQGPKSKPFVGATVRGEKRLGGSPITVGGREARLVPSSTPDSPGCEVLIPQRTFTARDGQEWIEVLGIEGYAGSGKSTDASCAGARAVAEVVAPRLPSPS